MTSQFTARNYKPLEIVHFTVRGNKKRVIFHDGNDHEQFLGGFRNLLDGINDPYTPTLLAYAQMPNHQHILLKLGEDPLAGPRLIRSISTSYAIAYNRRNHRRGKVFQRPFRGRIVRGADHLVNTFAYIHLNPDSSLRVDNSSHGFYAGLREDPHIDPTLAWQAFGGRAGYLEFFNDMSRIRVARAAARAALDQQNNTNLSSLG
jgi:REP element-mobilizing transposase RayT